MNDKSLTHTMTVEWGHCDAAGIIFYPNYFRWFDAAFHRLLRGHGIDQRVLVQRYGIVGTALSACDARFLTPVTYGDEIEIACRIVDWKKKGFTAECTISKDARVAVIGNEHRFWALRDEQTGKLTAGEIPQDFRALFESAP